MLRIEKILPLSKNSQRQNTAIFLLISTCLLLCVGCDVKEELKKQIEKFVNKEVDRFARDYIDLMLKGEVEQAKELFDPKVVNSKTQSQLQEIANLLNKGELISIEIIGVNMFRNRDRTRNTLTYQLQFKDAWFLAIVTVDDVSVNRNIYRFQVKSIPRSLEEINAFTFSGKSFHHYIILLIAIGIPLFILYTIVLCIRTKMKRKWLWIIFMLFGVGKYSFNWTSGQMGFMPIAIQLFSASAFKGGLYAPWIISFSVPFGALLFLRKRRKMRKTEMVDATMAPGSESEITDESGS